MSLTSREIYYGQDMPLPEQMLLRAGPLSLAFEDGSLRTIKAGDAEVVRLIYSAVRDHNWATIIPQLSNIETKNNSDSFYIRFKAEHLRGDIHFVWTGTIEGAADGTLTFDMDGEVLSTFRRNRIGFCVLHSMAYGGQQCIVEHVDGTQTEGIFPEFISPHQPFKDMRAIRYEASPGTMVEVRFEGDTFEMEDQRNWTDASYKTYCTPLSVSYPVTVEKGMKIQQRITVRLIKQAWQDHAETEDSTLRFSVGRHAAPLPPIGLAVASHGQPLTDLEIQRLKELNLSHLRIDLHPSQPDMEARLYQAAHEARALDIGLEAALHLSADPERDLQALRASLDVVKPPIATWLIYRDKEFVTSEEWIRLAREILGDYDASARFGGGTDGFFAELNRNRPALDGLDCVNYSLNPQVHAFDSTTMVENLAAQGVTLASARQFCGNVPLTVSPITLRIRYNPVATAPEAPPAPGELPSQVDVRQMSLFAAGWMVGSIKYLAENGVSSLTYFETSGWKGIMETANGSPLTGKFHSIPGSVFPAYHALADIGGFAGGEVVTSQSSAPLVIDGIVLRKGDNMRVIMANFGPLAQRVMLEGLMGEISTLSLDETNAESAMREPEGYRAQAGEKLTALTIELKPFALVRIDSQLMGENSL